MTLAGSSAITQRVSEANDPHPSRPVAPRPWSVSQLTQRLRGMLGGLGRVSVEGEVSAIKPAASGHLYFDLKDLDSKLSCAIWRSQVASALRFEMREGDSVVVHGKLDVYAPRGTYNLNVQRVERAGVGTLLAQLEQLKSELKARGWFDRKRALPGLPRVVGVVTSRDGAAFQDFLRTRSLRWPGYPVRLVHTPVQGTGAAAQIADAIRRCDASGVDVIVLIRGGGSLEDLWAFNELAVAQAVFETRAPVISGVGHETDVTLCDLVADVRAHTPTDAAQTVLPDRRAMEDALERGRNQLIAAIDRSLELRRERVERMANARVLRDALGLLEPRRERLGHLSDVLGRTLSARLERLSLRLAEARRRLERRSPMRQIAERSARMAVARTRLTAVAARCLEARERALEQRTLQLEALSPLAVLRRGFSITYVAGTRTVLRSVEGVSQSLELETRLADGSTISRVSEVRKDGGR